MAQRILGLDFGAHTLKIAEAESSFRGVQVKSVEAFPLPAGLLREPEPPGPAAESDPSAEAPAEPAAPDPLDTLLGELKARGKFAAQQITAALPGDKVSIHMLEMPFSDRRRIDQTIQFELENQIPFDLEQYVYDYRVVDKSPTSARLLVGLVRRDVMSEFLLRLQKHGIDPRQVLMSPLTYASMALEAGISNPPAKKKTPKKGEAAPDFATGEEEGPVAVLDLGHETTSLCILRHGEARFVRTLKRGAREVEQEIAQRLKVDESTAASIKENQLVFARQSQGAARDIQLAAERALSGLIRELKLTLQGARAQLKLWPEKIYLAGGFARVSGLPEWFTERLGVPCELIPLQSWGGPAGPEDAQAIAIAIAGSRGGRGAMLNFRRGPFAYKGDFGHLKGKIIRLGAGVAVLAALGLAHAWLRLDALDDFSVKLDGRVCEMGKQLLNTGKCEPEFIIEQKIRTSMVQTAAPTRPRLSAFDLLHEITKHWPGDAKDLDIREIDIKTDGVRIEGRVPTFESINNIDKALKGAECFGEINRGKQRRTLDGKAVEFDLLVKITCT
ncbi:MAG: hypothetical protein GMKNLPBB_00610 [Myxococcota bacterium]|nr:hypothetical protein [Myxococcota bacterium]